MRILIADDEAPARRRLRALIDEIGPPYRVVGEAANGSEAVRLAESERADLVLMDIRMPGVDGLDAAAQLARQPTPPALVFTTAFEEHALAAFSSQAIDYLLKPIRRERLQVALHRAASLSRAQLQAVEALREPSGAFLSASFRGGVQRVALERVIYLRADAKYVTARHLDGELLLEESLVSLEERFPDRFLRIHRNALISLERLAGLERSTGGGWLVRLHGCEERLEVSRRHLGELKRRLKE